MYGFISAMDRVAGCVVNEVDVQFQNWQWPLWVDKMIMVF